MSDAEKALQYDAFVAELERLRAIAEDRNNSTVRAVTLANSGFWKLCRQFLPQK